MEKSEMNTSRQEYHGRSQEDSPSGIGAQFLGVAGFMSGVGALLFWINGSAADSFLFSGVLFILLGGTLFSFGKIIPYLVSIATDLRGLREESRENQDHQ